MQLHLILCRYIYLGLFLSFFMDNNNSKRVRVNSDEIMQLQKIVYCSDNQINIMRENRKKQAVKFPLIRERVNLGGSNGVNKSLKLQKINRQKHIALIDISKINKIEKEYAQITKRQEEEDSDHRGITRDQMRESKLLLLKNIAPVVPKKANQLNMLSSLVEYSPKLRTAVINSNNLSHSPSKYQRSEKKKKNIEKNIVTQYQQPEELLKVDFVKLFIVQELLYYISKTNERVKEEMAGFCKFYNENNDEDTIAIIGSVVAREKDYLNSLFLQRLGFYVFLILGTDAEIQQEANFLLNSLTDYIHTNNLIILDLLMEILDIQKFPLSSQFHVYNTLRFNQDRRKIKHSEDKMNLITKNNAYLIQIIKSVVLNCGFESLRTFVFEVLSNTESDPFDKIKEVSMMLVSLDSILTSSIHHLSNKPKPPFLPPNNKPDLYTLVLDMDQTLIHTKEIQGSKSIFLIRPYCQEFLDQMSKHFEVVIFTAAVKEYADNILDSIDQQGRIVHRLYRQHTRIEDYVSIKDLQMIGRDLSRSIIIDNIASNFKNTPRNGIAISTWTGQPDDISLFNLIPVLKKLVVDGVKDVRDGLQKLSEFMQTKMSKGQEIVFEQISLKGL